MSRIPKGPSKPPAPPASSAAVRKIMQGNVGKDTQPEVKARRALFAAGLRYRKDYRPDPTMRCRVDVAFLRERVLLFIDGCFWHGCPVHFNLPAANSKWWEAKIARTVARDARQLAALEAKGWTVVRVWEHEPAESLVERVRAVLQQARQARAIGRRRRA